MSCREADRRTSPQLVLGLLLTALVGCDQGECASLREQEIRMNTTFENALINSEQAYLDEENALRSGGAEAVSVLTAKREHGDPVGRFMANCLLDWIEGRQPENEAALAYLDGLPAKLELTPIVAPSPTGSAAYLTQTFGPNVAEMLALRLLKGTDWPHWRVMSVLFYLKENAMPSTSVALIRYAGEVENEEWREASIEAISAANDPDLEAKLTAERERIEEQNAEFHPALRVLLEEAAQ